MQKKVTVCDLTGETFETREDVASVDPADDPEHDPDDKTIEFPVYLPRGATMAKKGVLDIATSEVPAAWTNDDITVYILVTDEDINDRTRDIFGVTVEEQLNADRTRMNTKAVTDFDGEKAEFLARLDDVVETAHTTAYEETNR